MIRLLVLLLLLPAAALAQPVIRTTISPQDGIVLGQQVHLYVDVLFPDTMPWPPQVATPVVTGAQVFRFESQATTMSDRIGGASYTGQRFEFAVYPRRGGRLQVAPATVALRVAGGADGAVLQTAATSFDVTVPPGVDPSQPVIASSDVTSDEVWEPAEARDLKPGDALRRTITRRAADIAGLAMRPIEAAAPVGVRVYADPPDVDDRVERGAVTGQRVDRLTYVFEQAGDYTLPGVDQPWWNLSDGALQSAGHPPRKVHVVGAAQPRRDDWRPAAASVVALAILGLAVWLATRWMRRRLTGEPAAFRHLAATARHGDAAATYRAFLAWQRHLAHPVKVPELSSLERSLFDPRGAAWDGPALVAALRRIRRRPHPAKPAILPALNPTGAIPARD